MVSIGNFCNATLHVANLTIYTYEMIIMLKLCKLVLIGIMCSANSLPQCVDETGMHPSTNEEFSQRLQELGEDNPTLAATLLGLNVRTGYTHAGTGSPGILVKVKPVLSSRICLVFKA